MPRDGFSRKCGKAEWAIIRCVWTGWRCESSCARQGFFRRYNLIYECILELFSNLLGLGLQPKDLTFVQISLRGIIVFLATLIMVRLGSKRSMAHRTPFDAILLVILASVLSRAINGSAPFLATIGGGAVLVALHRLFALLAFHSHSFGILVKGKPDVIVRDVNAISVRCAATMSQPTIWKKTCASTHTSTRLRKFDSHALNAAARSALSKKK